MSPERSSGQVWREATSGVWGVSPLAGRWHEVPEGLTDRLRAPSARKRIYHRLGNTQQTARLRTRTRDSAPRPRWPLRARPGQGFTLDPRTRFDRLRSRISAPRSDLFRPTRAAGRDGARRIAARSLMRRTDFSNGGCSFGGCTTIYAYCFYGRFVGGVIEGQSFLDSARRNILICKGDTYEKIP